MCENSSKISSAGTVKETIGGDIMFPDILSIVVKGVCPRTSMSPVSSSVSSFLVIPDREHVNGEIVINSLKIVVDLKGKCVLPDFQKNKAKRFFFSHEQGFCGGDVKVARVCTNGGDVHGFCRGCFLRSRFVFQKWQEQQ